MDSPIITGYYRYTDIWFEWHQALPNPDDRGPLKAILSHDSLVHEDHPLHKDGITGIELYMGTLNTGESRLLFSSAQVDYIRYWLHEMKLTDQHIPIPYSDCLLTESELRNVSPVIFKSGGELRNSIKKIEKNNKRLRGTNPTLNSRRDTFERVRTFWSEKVGVWCSIDFEAWDRDHTAITEVGWSLVRWENGEEIHEDVHLIVKEHQNYTQSYVADHKKNFSFGESEIVSKATFKRRLGDLITSLSIYGPVFLVFHDHSQDIKYLRSKAVGIPLNGINYKLPDATPTEGIFIVDTVDLFSALEGDGNQNGRSLDRVCKHLRIYTEYLHNAGNDAHYTLLAMRSMASGDPLDIQRDKRWPNRTGLPGLHNGVKVQFQPWEEDSDISDQEGIYPPIAGYDTQTGVLLESGELPVD